MESYSLSDIVDNDGAVGVPVVHGRQGLVSLLACGIPYLELDCRALVERNGLCEEGSTDGGFSVVIKLILSCVNSDRPQMADVDISRDQRASGLTLTNRRTSELCTTAVSS